MFNQKKVVDGILYLITGYRTPSPEAISESLGLSFDNPYHPTLKLKCDLVQKFQIDPRTCKVVQFNQKPKSQTNFLMRATDEEEHFDYIGVLSEFPKQSNIEFSFKEYQGHLNQDIN